MGADWGQAHAEGKGRRRLEQADVENEELRAKLAAAEALLAQQVERPEDLHFAEEVGAALFGAGRFDEAAEVLNSVADRRTDPEQRNRARSNAGLATYRDGRLTRALEDAAYQGLLDALCND